MRPSSANSLKLLAQQVITVGLDLLFPPLCVNCERVGGFLCPRCRASIQPGAARSVPGLDDICVRTDFEGAIRKAIHALKYDGQTRLAEALGDLIDEAVLAAGWPVDVVTAVPLHESRLRERGYNQAALLAQAIARRQQWAFHPEALHRVRATASQVNLNAQERRANVDGAFAADAAVVAGKRVLLVDDVLTTGATLSACAEALREAGATLVFGTAVAGAVSIGDR